MKTVAFIPIKLGSQRVPLKNIKPFFDGTPLMHFIQRACLDAKEVDEIFIYCSDESVREYTLPGVHFLKRPDYLDLDNINSNDIINEFIKVVDSDIYVEAHTTAPFTTSETLDICINTLKSGNYDSFFCAQKLLSFLWKDGKPMNFDPSHFPRTQDLPLILEEGSNCYGFMKDTFLINSRRVGINPYVHILDKIEAIDIDYPSDFEIANVIYKEIISK
jgi:CMP-N-acetylneuraminic acid synthetase